MELYGETGDRYSREERRARPESRTNAFQYAHLYCILGNRKDGELVPGRCAGLRAHNDLRVEIGLEAGFVPAAFRFKFGLTAKLAGGLCAIREPALGETHTRTLEPVK